MLRKLLLSSLLPVLLVPTVAQGQEKLFYNIAHAINHSQYIDWAVENGANAIESDLRFTDYGLPRRFQHGVSCECMFATSDLCRQMMQVNPTYRAHPDLGVTRVSWSVDACMVNEHAPTFLNKLATKTSIALFIVDSKVGSSVSKDYSKKEAAGRNVINMLEEELFAKGYLGKVIVGVDQLVHRGYTRAAAEVAAKSEYADRIYFSIDENGKRAGDARVTIEWLRTYAPGKAVYGNGITAMFERDYTDAFTVGVAAEQDKRVHLNYVWTADTVTSMARYIGMGVRGVMTNNPRTLNEVLKGFPYLRLARPEDPHL